MSLLLKFQLLGIIFTIITLTKVSCLYFTFPTFHQNDANKLLLNNSYIQRDAIQVTPENSKASMSNLSGRALYKDPFELASFNTTFVLNITPDTSPGGEGIAFILASEPTLPENSSGQWLGIVNASTNGTSQAAILAVEFDTRQSSIEDGPNNHVGININSISSLKQVSLSNTKVNLSSGLDVFIRIEYSNDVISVFGSMTANSNDSMETLLVSPPLNLSSYFKQEVYVGFSASTSNYTELNCVKAWEFNGVDIGNKKNLWWIWIIIPLVIIIAGLVLFMVYFLRKKNTDIPEDTYPRIEDQIQHSSMAPKKYQLKELMKATGGFSLQNKLGEGGFGMVYKGILGNNKEVAVKRVSKNSRQGKQEFIAEVTTIGSLHHKNLVKLIGWCYESKELLLVYEFMPRGSLDKYLFNQSSELEVQYSKVLDWKTRNGVIRDVAQALDYLHNGCEKRVLHRDIKASNIMLDIFYNGKLGDFGLARTIQKRNETHHSTKEIAGTPGYMAPETFLTGRATVETDVYAFGVLVLEVVCGKRPGNMYAQDDYKNSIVYWVWELYGKGEIISAVDKRISYEENEIERVKWEEEEEEEVDIERVKLEEEIEIVLILGLACCHPNPNQRPSMKTVLMVLNGEVSPPNVPLERPAFVWPAMPSSFKEGEDNSLINGTLTPFTQLSGR
ncbi:probable L-type lectin-domain containing receptor kinase S.5 [Trifolium pratense]|uniref:probable L-type lectin-domain containing receptor kinase S.5 n=1 Tax=Trifolium pratense TaxID=57577 RepID=UPI001E6967F4|nr:probable L-type lectin-domain containing receptor kinase S.5 [Trifolium pratense]